MPWYNMPSLRHKIITGEYTKKDALIQINAVLDFMFNNFYADKKPKTTNNYILEKHIDRVGVRLIELYENSEFFRPIIEAKKVIINGIEYKNIPECLFKIISNDKLIESLEPESFVNIHGDLHFQNILVSDTNNFDEFIIADPRGEVDGGDIFYDLGKLFHSVNAKYDLIHTDQYKINKNVIKEDVLNFDFNYVNKDLEDLYESLFVEIKESLNKRMKNMTNWEFKALFSEAMHLSSVMPFHLYEKEARKSVDVVHCWC